jgi:uncharacterized membrane protein
MARDDRRAERLDQPLEARRGVLLPRPSYSPDAFGRFAELIARFIGTARFIAVQTGFVVAWIVWNTTAPETWRFDPYAFQFLNVMLSLQAAYAAPLILLAQNRQDDRDRVQYEQDRGRSERTIADTEYLTRELAGLRIAVGDVVTRDYLRSELRDLLEELQSRPGQGGGGRGDERGAAPR